MSGIVAPSRCVLASRNKRRNQRSDIVVTCTANARAVDRGDFRFWPSAGTGSERDGR
jgi:hypothetical protein